MPKGFQWPTDPILFGFLAYRMRDKIGFHPFIDWDQKICIVEVEMRGEVTDHDCGPDCICWTRKVLE